MADTGWLLGGTAISSDIDGGDVEWESPAGVKALGGNTYTWEMSNGEYTQHLLISNFSISLPDYAVVSGISVRLNRDCVSDDDGDIVDDIVRLRKSTGYVGDDKAAYDWPSATASQDYGSSSNLWGTTWSKAEVESSSFGVGIRASKVTTNVDADARLWYVQILVTYTIVVVDPIVTTQAVDDVGKVTATANGNITDTGGANATRRGFCYKVGTSGDPTTSDSVEYADGSFGTGAFDEAMSGLLPNTGYRVRAYAVNSAGTGYGTTVQLTTLTAFMAKVFML